MSVISRIFSFDAENPDLAVSQKYKSSSTYDLRSRTVTKQPGEKIGTQSEIPNVQNSKRRKHKSQRPSTITNDIDPDDIIEENCSQESVSMLQECYKNYENSFPELKNTCIDSALETIADNDDVRSVSDDTESPRADGMKSTVEIGVQTEFPIVLNSEGEKEITKHANFVACVIRLNAMLSSKNKKVDLSLQDVLQIMEKNPCGEEFSLEKNSERDETLPTETMGRILKSSRSENTFRETVDALIFHLENILKEDFLEAAGCWRNSIYEKAIDILNEAIDCDPGIRKIVESFLFRLLESFSNDKERTKNLVLESKAVLIMTFSKSAYLSLSLVQYLIGHLKLLETKPMVFEKKQFRSNFIKNFCVLIRILEVSLESVKSRLRDKEADKVLNKGREIKDYNVLEMWKKHWNVGETPKKSKGEFQWKLTVTSWLNTLDEVLVNCVNQFPITAMAVERCKRQVMEILKICYPEEGETEN